jgi:hypothetical protein
VFGTRQHLHSGFDKMCRAVVHSSTGEGRIGAGAQCALTETLVLGFAYELLWQGDLGLYQAIKGDASRGLVAGQFPSVNLNFFSINLTRRARQ